MRILLLVPVAAGLVWSIAAAPLAVGGTAVSRMADRIATGDQYDASALRTAADAAGRATGLLCGERLLRDTLLIRSRLAELALSAGEITEVDRRFEEVREAATALLACSPGQSVGWLALFWTDLQSGRGGTPATQEILRRSYRFGPHELWVQVRRNPLALATYDSLAADLKAGALDEFVEILKAGAYPQAASILAGAGNRMAPRLLERVASLPDSTRRALARQLRLMDEDITVPGVEPRDPRWR